MIVEERRFYSLPTFFKSDCRTTPKDKIAKGRMGKVYLSSIPRWK
jgi:hypothetical protein